MIIYYLTNSNSEDFSNIPKSSASMPAMSNSKPIFNEVRSPKYEIPKVESPMNNPLINYSGINEDNNIGAELTTAFEPPSGFNTTPDEIDFNKNNNDKYNVKDYLPKDINNDWFDTDFANAQHNIDDNNLINPDRFIIGINTIGQSLKSPSWDIRGTIANPKYSVSPWGNSTYEPDYNLKPLC